MNKYLVISDPHGTKYEYSEDIFNFLLKRLKYIEQCGYFYKEENIDIQKTKEDLSNNGSRIWLLNGTYISIYDCEYIFSIEFDLNRNKIITLKNLIDYIEV